jgi:hypothetical protein
VNHGNKIAGHILLAVVDERWEGDSSLSDRALLLGEMIRPQGLLETMPFVYSPVFP